MNDVKLANLDLARNARQASAPQPSSSQSESNRVEARPKAVGVDQYASINNVSETQQPVKEEEQAVNKDKVREAVTRLNDYVQNVQRDLEFSMDDHSGRLVVTVTDRNTKEVVRQIPDELALKLAQNLQQDEPLSLFNVKV